MSLCFLAATAYVGESFKVRFKVTDSGSGQPKVNLEDVGVLVFLAPGIWQQREWAKAVGEGVYEMSFAPPQAGVYYVHFQLSSSPIAGHIITDKDHRRMVVLLSDRGSERLQ